MPNVFQSQNLAVIIFFSVIVRIQQKNIDTIFILIFHAIFDSCIWLEDFPEILVLQISGVLNFL